MKKYAILCYFDESVTDGPTDRQTDGRTDRPSYRDARSHLKTDATERSVGQFDGLIYMLKLINREVKQANNIGCSLQYL